MIHSIPITHYQEKANQLCDSSAAPLPHCNMSDTEPLWPKAPGSTNGVKPDNARTSALPASSLSSSASHNNRITDAADPTKTATTTYATPHTNHQHQPPPLTAIGISNGQHLPNGITTGHFNNNNHKLAPALSGNKPYNTAHNKSHLSTSISNSSNSNKHQHLNPHHLHPDHHAPHSLIGSGGGGHLSFGGTLAARCCFHLLKCVNVRRCVAALVLLTVVTIVYYTHYVDNSPFVG